MQDPLAGKTILNTEVFEHPDKTIDSFILNMTDGTRYSIESDTSKEGAFLTVGEELGGLITFENPDGTAKHEPLTVNLLNATEAVANRLSTLYYESEHGMGIGEDAVYVADFIRLYADDLRKMVTKHA